MGGVPAGRLDRVASVDVRCRCSCMVLVAGGGDQGAEAADLLTSHRGGSDQGAWASRRARQHRLGGGASSSRLLERNELKLRSRRRGRLAAEKRCEFVTPLPGRQTQAPARADAAGRDAALVAACLRLTLVYVSVAMTLQLAQRRRKAFPAPWITALWLSVEDRRACSALVGPVAEGRGGTGAAAPRDTDGTRGGGYFHNTFISQRFFR